jgi:UDP-N-acetylmuramyl pentapeptide phosphotransferase/UDP-N-acetylglucosamine-1-phosphate transferase
VQDHPWLAPAIALGAFALSWLLVLLVRTQALRKGLLDLPNERSSHVRPTPRLGGLGILAAILGIVVAAAAASSSMSRELAVVLGLATAVSLVSLLDDLRGLPPLGRLLVHVTTAVIAVAWLGPLDITFPGITGAVAIAVGASLTVVWIAGFINAFNFMDGTDGIAAIQALIAAAAWGAAGWWLNDPPMTMLAIAIAAAAAGFLLHNWPPATIFMGDVGSALLGFLLAALPLLADAPRSLLAAVLPVWPFVFDTTITLVRRALRGENLLAAHRSHLYQRLTQCGWPHGRTAILYAGLALAGALVAVPMISGALQSTLPGLTLLVLGPALLWMLVASQEARRRDAALALSAGSSDDA